MISLQKSSTIVCGLCPHLCQLKLGKTGFCGVRKNIDGKVVSLDYGHISAINMDPIEKKPLYHFHPGTQILSIGSFGCNLTCKHCQNHTIAQGDFSWLGQIEKKDTTQQFLDASNFVLPEKLVNKLDEPQFNTSLGIAYTYNEPIVWYEYMCDCAALVHKKGKLNVMVSNGYINKDPLQQLFPLIDAFSIDLKAFSDDFYTQVSGGHLQPVLDTLELIAHSDKHLEIEYLVIPGLNDDVKEFNNMLNWYVTHLGRQVPLHVNRYFPQYKMHLPPTPIETLEKLADQASAVLDYVHVGNV
ncbi:MAG: AmmeMemoRadiSam system radical SAM enzyme [Treponema sp. CETP13]|nr:MAG: AmmeMemoRadiSam system radical SAM enzyme [Treponema sp. CETP13]